MVFDLTTNEHCPLLGTIRAIVGLCEVGLKAKNFILVFASDDVDTLLCLGLHSVHTSVSRLLDAFDARTGFIFDLVDCACRLSQLVLQAINLTLRISLDVVDALVGLPNCPIDSSVGIGPYLFDDDFRFREQLGAKPVGLTFELIDPILGLPQLG